MSSENVGSDSKERFSKILVWFCRFHNTLPPSYYARNFVAVEDGSRALDGFANIYKGQYSGQPVRIKALRTQNALNTGLIKYVRISTISDDPGSDALPYRNSIMKLYGGNTSHTRIYCPSSGSRRRRPRFPSSALGCQTVTSSSILKERGGLIDYSW